MTKDETQIAKVESSSELATNAKKTMDVMGLEDVPTSMIPVPFYKLVQPGSTNVTMTDGQEAPAGTFLMGDLGESAQELKFLLLRAKRQHREFKDDNGVMQSSPSMGVLGLNISRMTPFILGVPVSSWSNFGQLMAQIKERKMEHAWDFPITATTEKQEVEKETTRGRQKVKYWTIKFSLAKEALSAEEMQAAQQAYQEYATSLDKGQEEAKPAEEEAEDIPF